MTTKREENRWARRQRNEDEQGRCGTARFPSVYAADDRRWTLWENKAIKAGKLDMIKVRFDLRMCEDPVILDRPLTKASRVGTRRNLGLKASKTL
jgi:hypothetical protein